jgi:dihydrofolate reductase
MIKYYKQTMIGIVATDFTGGIGKNGEIPWRLKEDMIRFRKITSGVSKIQSDQSNCIIMGRKTWDTIKCPLPNRINIVVSNSLSELDFKSSNNIANSFVYQNKPHFIAKNKQEVLEWIECNKERIHKTFVIGGKQIYDLFFDEINTFELTILKNDYECDTKIDLTKIYDNFKVEQVFPQFNHTNIVMIKYFF